MIETAIGSVATATTGTATMLVGTIEDSHDYTRIAAGARLRIPLPGSEAGNTVVVRWLVPDDLVGHHYDIELRIDGQCIGRRAGSTNGFGRRTLFVRTGAQAPPEDAIIEIVNHAREPLHLIEVTFPSDLEAWLNQPPTPDDFTLSLLQKDGEKSKSLIQDSAMLRDAPGVQKAGAFEVYYARQSPEEIRDLLRRTRARLEPIGFKMLAIPCSWWAGTPREVWDRLDFQQVCFSPTDTHDPGEEFRNFMGDRWQPGYGPTIPNIWSNTPWQTMNNAELNALRHERLEKVIDVMEAETSGVLIGYVIENEPAYWAVEASDTNYPVRRSPLWADFNPHTVEAAKRNGVTLNPTDGLSLAERVWLHQNAAEYIQATLDVVTTAGVKAPVYSHALLSQLFPLEATGHYRPYADLARLRGALTGLETLFDIDIDGLWRVREWGPWGCVNREENDCRSIEVHLAMLRVHYMLGADLFNSYNWDTINQNGRAISYMNDFLDNLANENGIVAVASQGDSAAGKWSRFETLTVPMAVRPEFPWATGIDLHLRAANDAQPLKLRLTQGVGGATISYRIVEPAEVATTGPTRIDFGDLTQIAQGTPLVLHLECSGVWEIQINDDGAIYQLFADMPRERRRSQYVIRHAKSEQKH